MAPSNVYIRSFFYLFYILIKHYYTKALSNQASSLALDLILSSGGQESWHLSWLSNNLSVGWHHRLHGHEFEQGLGVGDGQGGLVCCSPWGRKELDTTEQLNWTELKTIRDLNATLNIVFLYLEMFTN